MNVIGAKLAKAIISVMKEVKGMEKNSRVGEGNMAYNGTKDQDVKEIFNEAFTKHGLCIVPTSIKPSVKVERWEETTNYGVKMKQSAFTEVVTTYLLMHESGEYVELAGYGHGVDNQDKGAGKATTYALKNCLLYTFLTPVGKIDDTDSIHSESIPVPQPTPEKKEVTWLTEEQLNKTLASDVKGIETVMKKYNGKLGFAMSKAYSEKLSVKLKELKGA